MDMFGIHHLLIVCTKGGECAHSKHESHSMQGQTKIFFQQALFWEVHIQGTQEYGFY